MKLTVQNSTSDFDYKLYEYIQYNRNKKKRPLPEFENLLHTFNRYF